MSEASSFKGVRLRGGFIIVDVEYIPEPLVDAVGRPAVAQTSIIGRQMHLTILASLNGKEKSVTLYHEILEAMTVAVSEAPASVREYNEGDFERAAYDADERFGTASPETLNCMLQFYGFREE